MQTIRSNIRPVDMASEQVIAVPTCHMRQGRRRLHTFIMFSNILHALTIPACNGGQSIDKQMSHIVTSSSGGHLCMCRAQAGIGAGQHPECHNQPPLTAACSVLQGLLK